MEIPHDEGGNFAFKIPESFSVCAPCELSA